MTIAFVSAAHNETAAGTHKSVLAVTIAATAAGNDVLVTVENGDNPNPAATVLSVTASGAAFAKRGASGITSASDSANAEVWIARSVPAGITTITTTWSAITVGTVTIAEYSGVVSLGQTTVATGTGTDASISLTTVDGNNVMVSGLSKEGTGIIGFSGASAGTLRTSGLALGNGLPDVAGALVDNTGASPGALTCTATHGSAAPWAAVAVELRTVLTAGFRSFQSMWFGPDAGGAGGGVVTTASGRKLISQALAGTIQAELT